jgi:polysaccharide export outer membrane protein
MRLQEGETMTNRIGETQATAIRNGAWRATGRRGAAWMLAGAMALALCACAGGRSFPPAPTGAELAGDAEAYKIGPLDTLNIVVWRNPELSPTVTVRPDGKISAPLAGEVQAAGLSPADLAKVLEDKLGKLVRDAKVSVIVSGFQGVYAQQIRIVGEATKTQSVPYRQDMTVLDVMIQAGGITDFADGNGAVLVRKEGKQYSLRLADLLKRGDISANARMQPGDIIIIPQSWF